jgi:toxin secretion/phage lysis holin
MTKSVFCGIIGAIGAAIAQFFGGWDNSMITLVIFMSVDYVSGLAIAGVFKKSPKSQNGGLESKAGFKGLCRKCMTLIFVMVAHRLDMMLGTDYLRNAVIIGFCANELVSILENAGTMGLPLPAPIVNAVDVLKKRSETDARSTRN